MPSLIGVVDEQVGPKTVTDHNTNKIGGSPDWPYGDVGVSLKCVLCDHSLCLIVQLYCPLEGFKYHRNLYVFGCCNPACWNRKESWLAVRCQVLDPQSIQPAKATPATIAVAADDDNWGAEGDDWGVDADDWGVTEDANNSMDTLGESGSQLKSQDETATVSQRTETCPNLEVNDGVSVNNEDITSLKSKECAELAIEKEDNLSGDPDDLPLEEMCLEDAADRDGIANDMNPVDSDCPIHVEDVPGDDRSTILQALAQDVIRPGDISNVLVPFFVNVFEEPASHIEDNQHVAELLRNYQQQEGGIQNFETKSSGGGGQSGEKYEKTAHSDSVFHKFMKRVSVCPRQCVRYEWGGSPLYIRPATTDIPSCCGHCGGRLVFEAQLMPALVNLLHFPDHSGTALEFGTVLLFTCEQSCWSESDKYRTERLVVQADPDEEKLKTVK